VASSDDYSYQPNTYQLIQGAGRLVGAIQTGETLEDDEYQDMLFALNGMVSRWQASGIHVWCQETAVLFLQPTQILYYIGQGTPDHCTLDTTWLQTASTGTAILGATSISVAAIVVGSNTFNIGDHIGIWLDSGSVFWTEVSGAPTGLTVPLVEPLPSQASAGAIVVAYTTDLVRPLRVPSGRRYQFAPPGGQPIETPLSIYSRLDYGMVPNKTTSGIPTTYFYDPQLGLAQFNVWPAPSNAQSAIKFIAQRPIQDFVNQGNTADFPIEWSACLRYGLALEIAPEYGIPNDDYVRIEKRAGEIFETCSSWDREPESIYFGVSRYPSVRN
jgi:hypothetical protein